MYGDLRITLHTQANSVIDRIVKSQQQTVHITTHMLMQVQQLSENANDQNTLRYVFILTTKNAQLNY